MKTFFAEEQQLHAPATELHNGGYVPHAEHPGRMANVLDVLGETERPRDFGIDPIARVHEPDYLDFLKHAFARWCEAGRSGDAHGYAWPVVGRRPLRLDRIDAQLGQFSFDASTPIAADTWISAYWAAQAALGATQHVLDGAPVSAALCRPPGHHSGASYLGGYCYLNNIAIAVQSALDQGHDRVAVLDIDYHHGNGTQDIFYERGDVFFASIHADPVTDYPFFWGHADEQGTGDGAGATLNLPLARGTDLTGYLPALDQALDQIAGFAPSMVFVSFGADTFEGDPISQFQLKTADYVVLARHIAALGLPMVVVMEGGYAVDALGDNVAAFLSGF